MKLFQSTGYGTTFYCWHTDAVKAHVAMAGALAFDHNAGITEAFEAIADPYEVDEETTRAVDELMPLGREMGSVMCASFHAPAARALSKEEASRCGVDLMT